MNWGEGGMGVVYKAVGHHDRARSRHQNAAARRLPASPICLTAFRSEAITVAKLNHSGIATLYSFTSRGRTFFMVMGVCARQDPGEHRARSAARCPGRLLFPWPRRSWKLLRPAHEMGIVHRDIKPANIMLHHLGHHQGNGLRHLAHGRGSAHDHEGRLIGTIEYISPERIEGKARRPAQRYLFARRGALRDALQPPALSEPERIRVDESHLRDPLPALPRDGL